MDWIGIATVVGVWMYNLLFALSVLFLYKQVKEIRQQLKSTTFHNYWSAWIEIDRWFVEHPELKPYFYESKIAPPKKVDHRLRRQLDSTAEMLLDQFAGIYFQRHCFETEEERGVFREYMRSVYRTQPFFQSFVDSHVSWYSQGFVEYLRGISE